MTNTSPSLALMVKLPSKSVVAPVDVPSNTTVAPGKGAPELSETVPLMVR